MSFPIESIGAVCKVIAGQSPEGKNYNKEGNGLPFYQGKKDFGDVYINPPSVWTTQITKEATAGDILMSVRAPVGPVNIAVENICIGRGLAAIRASSRINKFYLFYYLLGIEDELIGNSGAIFNSINKTQIENISIPLPSLSIQEKIVEKIDAIFAEIDEAICAAEDCVKSAEALFQSYLREVFKANKNIDELSNIGSFLKLEYGKGLDESDRAEDGAYFAYGANGVKAKTNKFLFDKPSIIVGRKGSAGELSLVFDKFWPLDVTYYVTHDSDKTDLKYLYYGLLAQNLPQYAKGVKPGINRNDVYALKMRLPSLIEQKKLALKLAQLSEKVSDLSTIYQNKIKSLDLMKKSILQQAFNSKLVKDWV